MLEQAKLVVKIYLILSKDLHVIHYILDLRILISQLSEEQQLHIRDKNTQYSPEASFL